MRLMHGSNAQAFSKRSSAAIGSGHQPMTVPLSICIPIYNFAKFIPVTLDSILVQAGVEEIEIVVVDGASTDDTEQVINRYRQNYTQIKYIRLPAKGGIDRDIARTVEHATGDYCWLFSGDDIMRVGGLREMLTHIES